MGGTVGCAAEVARKSVFCVPVSDVVVVRVATMNFDGEFGSSSPVSGMPLPLLSVSAGSVASPSQTPLALCRRSTPSPTSWR